VIWKPLLWDGNHVRKGFPDIRTNVAMLRHIYSNAMRPAAVTRCGVNKIKSWASFRGLKNMFSQGFEGRGECGMVLVSTLGTNWVQNQDFSKLRFYLSKQFRHKCIEYYRIVKKPSKSKKLTDLLGVRFSKIYFPRRALQRTPQNGMCVGGSGLGLIYIYIYIYIYIFPIIYSSCV